MTPKTAKVTPMAYCVRKSEQARTSRSAISRGSWVGWSRSFTHLAYFDRDRFRQAKRQRRALRQVDFLSACGQHDRRAGAAADGRADKGALLAAHERADERAARRRARDLQGVFLSGSDRGPSDWRGPNPVPLRVAGRRARI